MEDKKKVARFVAIMMAFVVVAFFANINVVSVGFIAGAIAGIFSTLFAELYE